jgi:hypothetical protein
VPLFRPVATDSGLPESDGASDECERVRKRFEEIDKQYREGADSGTAQVAQARMARESAKAAWVAAESSATTAKWQQSAAQAQLHSAASEAESAQALKDAAAAQTDNLAIQAGVAEDQRRALVIQTDAARHARTTAKATLVLAGVTAASVLVTLGVVIATFRSANATRDSVHLQSLSYEESTRPWFEANFVTLIPYPSRKEVTYAVVVVNHGPGVASSYRPTVELSPSPDRIDKHRELLASTLESGVIGVDDPRMLQRTNIPYRTVAGSKPEAAYLHVCCTYRSAATGRCYYMDHVLYFLPVACSTDAPEERQYTEHYRGSKLAYFATVEDSAGSAVLRWRE